MNIKELVSNITDEYGQLHEEGCDLNNEDGAYEGCDCAMADLGKAVATALVEHLSHDISFKDEEQRKEAVTMYLQEYSKGE